jgi:acetyl-CoA synthetase
MTASNNLKPIWVPDPQKASKTRLGRWMAEKDMTSVADFHQWTVSDRSSFWSTAIEKLNLALGLAGARIAEREDDVENIRWLPDSRHFNISTACVDGSTNSPAIVYSKPESAKAEDPIQSLSREELGKFVNRIAAGLQKLDLDPGSKIATVMTMNIEAVAAYLAIIQSGYVAVSIAESFAAPEIESRLKIADVSLVLTAGFVSRAGRSLPLYERIVQANAPRAVVIENDPDAKLVLRDDDLSWDEFIGSETDDISAEPVSMDANAPINILFSSGTTGDPKAIIWTQLTPIKCAVDGMLLHDIGEGDVVCWPTSLGWMMGPWLIFASLLNKAAIAIYDDAPMGPEFGQFVSDAKVTMLGVVPTIVKAWRASQCMEELDWSSIRCFSSTGEASTADDMVYLSQLAGGKPIIEYCGGTEIGGGYMSSTMVQPNVAAAFSTPAFGIGAVILDEDDQPADEGQLYLIPPSIGLSQTLLNRDHHETYFANVPQLSDGTKLRRHGDFFVRLDNGYYTAGGRADDTMNLGGIKVSSVEIERVLNQIEPIRETAAVAVSGDGAGPTQLVVFAVLVESNLPIDASALQKEMNGLLKSQLNPLFKVSRMEVVESLPRTASNKIMRRLLRDRL